MKKRGIVYKLPLFVFVFCATVLITFQMTHMFVNDLWQQRVTEMIRTDKTAISEKLTELDNQVKSSSVYASESDTKNLVENTVNGYLEGLGDNYAMYLNENQYANFISSDAQKTSVGIGIIALYDMRSDGIYIVNVYPDSPASKAGILPGDVITHVNGGKVTDKGFYVAMSEIANGKVNAKVKLNVRKIDGTSHALEVERDVVPVQSITSRLYENNIGIVRINEFDANCVEDFKREAQKLITSGADRFVIDIRNNPGGAPENIVLLLDFLLSDGVLISGKDRDGNLVQYSGKSPADFKYPMVIVVNKNTVCGAELFAAAMRDYKNAPLIGNTTYGKATDQKMYTMPDGSALSLSYIMYSTPKVGASFDKTGLLPNQEVSLSPDAYENFHTLLDADDAQLVAAVEVVSQMEYTGPGNY